MQQRSGLDYFINEVRGLVKSKPPYNSAFISRAIHTLLTAVTILEGLKEIVRKQEIEIAALKESVEIKKKAEKPKKEPKPTASKEQIAEDYKAGMTIKQISEKHKISMGRISQITLEMGLRDYGTIIPQSERLSGSRNPIYTKYFKGGDEPNSPSDADRSGEDGNGSGDH